MTDWVLSSSNRTLRPRWENFHLPEGYAAPDYISKTRREREESFVVSHHEVGPANRGVEHPQSCRHHTLAQFERVGRRITGNPQKGSSPGDNKEKVNITNQNGTCRSFIRAPANEKGDKHRDLPEPRGGLVQRSRNRVPAVTQRQRVYLDGRWLAQSLPGHGIDIEEGHARQPKNLRRSQSVWTPADIVDLKTLKEEWA